MIMALFFILIAAGIYFLYSNSYAGVVRRGTRALDAGNYSEAQSLFERAMSKDNKRPEAYTGLSGVYAAQNDLDAAEAVFLTGLEEQTDNADLYEACVNFYMDTEQQEKIPELLDDASDTVQEALDAVAHGADYLGVGAVFATHTKTDVSEMPRQTLLDICNAVDVPVVAIGGIHKENILQLKGTGVDGVALVSAIFAAKDIEAECRELRTLSEQIIK